MRCALGALSGQVALGGALIGASTAARISLDLRLENSPLPAGQLLVTPLVDLADPAIKADAAIGLWPINADDLDILISHYAGAGTSLTDPRLSPALEKLPGRLPKTLIVSAGLDPLASQGEAFAKSLTAAGTPVTYRRYDALPLGFDLFAGVVDEARSAIRNIAENWVDMLRNVEARRAQDAA
ncbi:MAG: alpha/beta hydrolase [Asticcacaulis sp.]|nr:alpha/beta hydrolase [Asticcacaulis sp.]